MFPRITILVLALLIAIATVEAFVPMNGRRVFSSSPILAKKAVEGAEGSKKIAPEDKPILSKSDVVAILQQKTQFHKDDIAKVLTEFADLIRDEVFEGGKEMRIKYFGSFKNRTRAPRTARNPRTGETVKVSGKKSLSFSPSSIFKADI